MAMKTKAKAQKSAQTRPPVKKVETGTPLTCDCRECDLSYCDCSDMEGGTVLPAGDKDLDK